MARETYRDLGDADLLDQLANARDEHFRLRFQHATGQLSSHARLRQVRRSIARIQTEMRAREIAAAEALASSGGPSEKDS